MSANDMKVSQIGMFMGRSRTFPRIGYPFGPGGYGKVGFFRLRARMRIGMQNTSEQSTEALSMATMGECSGAV